MRALGMLAWLVVVAGLAAGETVLVRDNTPTSTIVVPANASATVRLAADELSEYLAQVSGAKVPIVAEGADPTGVTIHVGPTSVARRELPPEPAAEQVLIRIGDGRVVIGGGSDRATLYAVYRFLETDIGCRWLSPDIETVPHSSTIRLTDRRELTQPAFDYRFFNGRSEAPSRWGLKVGLNGLFTDAEAKRAGGGYYLPAAVPGCHAYALLMPPEPNFSEHPEWFPLIAGKREPTRIHGRQLCVTAPGLADAFAAKVIRLFDNDPALKLVSISPNDGYGWCECPACLDLDRRLCGGRTTRQGLLAERPFVGDRVFWFANQVAERVAQVHPDRRLLVLAYVNYAEPPDTIRPAPNIIPWLCHYAPADYSRPIADPASAANAQFNDLLRRWAERSPDLLFYSYVSKSMWWRLPRPVTANFAADLKHLARLGVHRYYCQSALVDWMLDGPLYTVLARLMWDPQADPEAVAADWIAHMFGAAAPAMTAYYRAVEEAVRATGHAYADNPPLQVPGLYDPAGLEQALAHLDAALDSAADPEVRRRVTEVRDVFRYGFHMIRCLEAAARLSREPSLELHDEAVAQGRSAISIRRVPEAVRFVEELEQRAALGVVARGFGKPEELGGRRCWNSDETGPGDGVAGWATLHIEVADPSRPVRLELDVWGKSDLTGIVVNTDGQQRSYEAGGVWTPLKPERPLSGREQWDTLVFVIPPEAMAPGQRGQTIGLGGGDSQIWLAAARVAPLP